MNALVPRATIEQLVQHRDRALELFEQAFSKIEAADAALKEAYVAWSLAAPGKRFYGGDRAKEVDEFHNAVSLPDRERFLRTARRLVDATVWTHVVESTDLEFLMDKKAKDELEQQMRYIPERTDREGQIINQEEIDKALPPVTVGNIVSTLERFAADADLIFMRGLVNAFTGLDRRFRSHDGFKVGSRIILDRLFDEVGHMSWRGKRDTLIDIERVFRVLDDQKPGTPYGGIIGVIENDRRGTWGSRASEHEGEFFKVRVFKNGNAHLWFTRDDLVEKVNKRLAAYYGEVLGDGMAKEDDPLSPEHAKTTPARYFGFFPTPDTTADELLGKIRLLRDADKPPLRVLEPSAGTGNLARRCITRLGSFPDWQRERYGSEYRFDNKVDCIEIQPHLAMQLEAEGIYNRVICGDFLQIQPEQECLYDVVVMNPPFDRERDIDHVVHAMRFLKPDGCLVAIMSAGTEFRETRKAIAFREMMEKMHAKWSDLPAGSFAEVGTYVNTCIVRVFKDGRVSYS